SSFSLFRRLPAGRAVIAGLSSGAPSPPAAEAPDLSRELSGAKAPRSGASLAWPPISVAGGCSVLMGALWHLPPRQENRQPFMSPPGIIYSYLRLPCRGDARI